LYNKELTIIHEIVEYIVAELELKIPHPAISAVSFMMYQFLVDNDFTYGKE